MAGGSSTMSGYYACVYCSYSTYHADGGSVRKKYGSKWDSKKGKVVPPKGKRTYTCADVVALLNKGPRRRR